MSEVPTSVVSEVGLVQTKNELVNPRIISQNKDQEGRNSLLEDAKAAKVDELEIKNKVLQKEKEIQERQENIFVKLKQKLQIPDEKTVEMQAQLLELHTAEDQLPNRKDMLDAYYEKFKETPLTNQEKRDLLKPDVLSQLTTDEYVDLWKRLNPYFLTHVTRQGFRDHNAMFYHSAGMAEFHNGFINTLNDERQLRNPLTLNGLKKRDETSVKMFLSKWVLQAENEDESKKRFDNLLHWSLASAPKYQDETAVHFAAQLVANAYYGGETGNEIFYVFPSDVLASQHDFAFNGWEKDFTKPQSETKWNDVFVWPEKIEDSGISLDSGMVFIPESQQVDPETGSKYVSEIKIVDGEEKRVLVWNQQLIDKFNGWVDALNDQSPIIQEIDRANKISNSDLFKDMLKTEMRNLGVPEDSIYSLVTSELSQDLFWSKIGSKEKLKEDLLTTNAIFKRPETTISSREYWEKYFSNNPDKKPKHTVFYDGNPTSAINEFQRKNGIGRADTSKTDGDLLGFEDRHVVNIENDPRADKGHQELIDLGNKIIHEHYAFR